MRKNHRLCNAIQSQLEAGKFQFPMRTFTYKSSLQSINFTVMAKLVLNVMDSEFRLLTACHA
jgi:hypothetical protein